MIRNPIRDREHTVRAARPADWSKITGIQQFTGAGEGPQVGRVAETPGNSREFGVLATRVCGHYPDRVIRELRP
jgi:hypothetical protein